MSEIEMTNDELPEIPDLPVDSPINPAAENMEVHHHPDLHHDKKYFRDIY